MISEKLQKAINEQITAEMWSANLYMSMSFYMQKEGLDGCAVWLKKQSEEELGHAYDMAAYMIKRGGVAKVDKVDVVPQSWDGALGVFENVYSHECNRMSIVFSFERIILNFLCEIHSLKLYEIFLCVFLFLEKET